MTVAAPLRWCGTEPGVQADSSVTSLFAQVTQLFVIQLIAPGRAEATSPGRTTAVAPRAEAADPLLVVSPKAIDSLPLPRQLIHDLK
jgi:hypothetical protein